MSEATLESLEASSEEIGITPYGEEEEGEEDAVTLQMDAPLDDGEWMVQTSANGHRRVSTEELAAERDLGALPATTRVWRNGMTAWTPLGEIADLTADRGAPAARPIVPAPLPPPPASSRKVVPPLPSPPLLSPPPPRIAPLSSSAALPSRPSSSSPAASPGPATLPSSAVSAALSSSAAALSASARGRASGSSPVASRALGLSAPPPRLEARRADSGPLPAFDEPPPARRVDTATSVALDLGGPEAPRRRSPWRGLFAQGAAAVVMLGATSYGLIHAGVFEQPAGGAGASRTLALQPSAEPSVMLMPKMSPPEEMLMPKMSPPEEMLMPKMSEASPAAEAPAAEIASPAPSSESAPAAPSSESASEKSSNADVSSMLLPRKATSAKRSAKAAADAAERRAKAAADAAERRAKWLEKRAAAAEARKQRRATAAAPAATATAVPERAAPPAEPEESATSTFDRQAAQAALSAAAELVKNCRPIGGPSGAGAVQVQYEPTGKVSSVTIVTPGFENSEAASCIQMLFRRARVPSFNGAKGATVRQRFEIP